MVGVSALAVSVMVGVAVAQEKTVVDGQEGGGYLVQSSNAMNLGENQFVASGTTISNRIYTNFVTQGGSGSGGGAGLGGVFFVDANANLTLDNVEFSTNTVIGGTGGSDPGVAAGLVSVALVGNQSSVIALGGLITDPGLVADGSSDQISTITLSDPNPLLKAGMVVTIPGLTGNTTAKIQSVSGTTVTFETPVTVEPTTVGLAPLTGYAGGDTLVLADVGSPEDPIVKIDSYVTGPGIVPGTKVKSVDYSSGEVTLTNPLTTDDFVGVGPEYNFVTVGPLSASPILSTTQSGGSSTINMLSAPSAEMAVGMLVTGEGIPDGARITAISADGTSVTIDKTIPNGTKVTGFTAATYAAQDGSNVLNLPVANTGLKVGMKVSGEGIPDGTTVTEVSPDGKTVKLSNNVTDVVPSALSFNGVQSASGSNITFVSGALPSGVQVGQVVSGPGIPEGTTVVSVSGSTVTLSNAVSDGSLVAALSFDSPLTTGGAMNGLDTTSGSGTNGNNGASSGATYAIVNSGEGGGGANGEDGGDASAGGVGGKGGKGGNGSDALPFNPDLTASVALGAAEAIIKTAQVVADLTPNGAPIPTPDVPKAAVDGSDLALTYSNLAKDTALLVAWNIGLSQGELAFGGNGGAGGDGGDGSTFFGGAQGGTGGDGGNSGVSAGTGGDGGAGGDGGDGGFGAGGGAGGSGGDGGSGKYAADGDAGAGGKGGFGAGDGSNGDGLYGEGGSGYGGAIFVRSGGTLTIKGNSTFSDNQSMGGSSLNGGEAGDQAGSDLFIMKGAQVTLQPGDGKTITFNGTIADDSKASYADASNAAGQGASITIGGPGQVVFNGANTYSGQTIIKGGTLNADDGVGINVASNINFSGDGRTGSLSEANVGVLMTSGTFARTMGTLGNKVQFNGSGGFAASGGVLTVNMGALSQPKTLTWGENNFFASTSGDGSLVFGSEYADNHVDFLNNIDLNGGSRQIAVVDNGLDAEQNSYAEIKGVISNGDLIVGETGNGFTGTLVLSGKNTYVGGTDVRSGTLITSGEDVLADSGDIDVAGGAKLILGADDTVRDITNDGIVMVTADITARDLVNNFAFTLVGGNLTLTGTYTGGADSAFGVGEGTSTLTTTGLTGSGAFSIAENGELVINQSGTSTYDGIITGLGSLTLDGTADLTLTGENTYSGLTVIETGNTLRLKDFGTLQHSAGVLVDGTFDIAQVSDGDSGTNPDSSSIKTLTGGGSVTLGANTLVLTEAKTYELTDENPDDDGSFDGTISGSGGVTVSGGTQTLAGTNTYTGATDIDTGAALVLTGDGTIADSSGVNVDGIFNTASVTADSVSIDALTGSGQAQIGSKTLAIESAFGTFSGSLFGSADSAFEINAGTQTLSGQNAGFYGAASVAEGAELVLTGEGNIINASGLHLDGTFDISGADEDRSLNGLTGDASAAKILLGANSIGIFGSVLDSTDPAARFAGVIGGSGGMEIRGGRQVLTGSNTYTGTTFLAESAELLLEGDGSVATSSGLGLNDGSLFDVSGITGDSAQVASLLTNTDGTGATVQLGTKSLEITAGDENTVFMGDIKSSGEGQLIVSGTQSFYNSTIETGLVADGAPSDAGVVKVMGGSITSSASGSSALNVSNGGNIEVVGTALSSAGPDIYAYFNTAADAHITIGTDAFFVANDDDRLLLVERDAGGEAGKVHLTIDNGGLGTDKAVVGNIIDNSVNLGTNGGTFVTVAAGSAWSGFTDAASFDVAQGASVFFEEGSKINGNLTVAEGAIVNGEISDDALEVVGDGTFADGRIYGNLFIHGNLSLGGFITPGHSPGFITATGDFLVDADGAPLTDSGGSDVAALSGARALLEVDFSQAPQAGVTYDQINIGGDMVKDGSATSGVLPVQLVGLGERGAALGDLSDIELIRIGGTVGDGAGVTQINRLTQNGQEIRIVSTETAMANRVAATSDIVVGTDASGPGQTEIQFFDESNSDNDGYIVYGLDSVVLDETFAFANLVGATHNAGDAMLGSFADRLGAQRKNSVWMRAGGSFADIDDDISSTQTVGFTQAGIDFISTDMLRFGILGSYGASSSDVTTELGVASLDGSLWNIGVEGSVTAGVFYLDALAQYGGSDWTISPVDGSASTISGMTATAAIETGLSLDMGPASITPWGQLLYQVTDYSNLDSAWVDSVNFATSDSLIARGGVRVEGNGGFSPYANVALAQDLYDQKTVTVDGYEYGTGTGGPRVEFGAGFSSQIGEGLTISTDLSGAQGIGDAGLSSYEGQVAVQGKW